MEKISRKIIGVIGSSWFFAGTLVLFTLQAVWLALTSRFPMAFDEAYHFGLIQFFGHHLNPIVTTQTSDTYRFGAIIQNTSTLYHYLLSFPYRIIDIFTNSLEIKVMFLRCINVGLAVVGLLIMRRLLRLINLSDGLANVLILAFAMTPIVAVLSAQINYFNLLIPVISLSVYEVIAFSKELRRGAFNTKRLLILLCVCLLSSLVAFAFLPILLAIAGIIIWELRSFKKHHSHKILASAKKSFASNSTTVRTLLIGAVLFSGFLFIRMYGVNVVRYHNPVPQCNQVLNVSDCKHYYAWNDNYTLRQLTHGHPIGKKLNAIEFTVRWLVTDVSYAFGEAMPLFGLYNISMPFFVIISLVGAILWVALVVNIREIFRKQYIRILTLITFIYLLFLWLRNYHDYLQLGEPVATNGRYFTPILLYLFVVLASGLPYMLALFGRRAIIAKAALATIVVGTFLGFGGFTQYLIDVTPSYGHLQATDKFLLPDANPSHSKHGAKP